MKLKKFLLRYYPPGIILEYIEENGDNEIKSIDLLNLSTDTDVVQLVEEITIEEPMIKQAHKPQLIKLIQRLIDKLESRKIQDFYERGRITSTHPLSICLLTKKGDRFATVESGSDCKIWDTSSGHQSEITAVMFSPPYDYKLLTGSADGAAKLWDSETGVLLFNLNGHTSKITCLCIASSGMFGATGSIDCKVKIWDFDTGNEIYSLTGHEKEILCMSFNSDGTQLITGSLDKTARIWSCDNGQLVHTLRGHNGGITHAQFEYVGENCATASADKTCRLWSVSQGSLVDTYRFDSEIKSLCFNPTGSRLAIGTSDRKVTIKNVFTSANVAILTGHSERILHVEFNPQGTKVVTASADKTVRIWGVEAGDQLQVLEGHTDRVFYCAFSYEGDIVLTGSKDNKCIIWKDTHEQGE